MRPASLSISRGSLRRNGASLVWMDWLVAAAWALALTSGTIAVAVGCGNAVGEGVALGDAAAVGCLGMGVGLDRGKGEVVDENVGVGLTGAKLAVGEAAARINAVGSVASRPGLPQPINAAIRATTRRGTGKRRIGFMRQTSSTTCMVAQRLRPMMIERFSGVAVFPQLITKCGD